MLLILSAKCPWKMLLWIVFVCSAVGGAYAAPVLGVNKTELMQLYIGTIPMGGNNAPHVVISCPYECSNVTGEKTFYASASEDGHAVARVDFFVGGALFHSRASLPYRATLDVSKMSVGIRTISVKAYGENGHFPEYSIPLRVKQSQITAQCAQALREIL